MEPVVTVTDRPATTETAASVVTDPEPPAPHRRLRRNQTVEEGSRGIVSAFERRRPATRFGLGTVHGVTLLLLVVAGLGPLLWLAKAAVTPISDTLRQPMAVFPNGMDWENVSTAWTQLHVDKYFLNTMILAAGSWVVQIVVATTAGYVLSVLRPRYAGFLNGLVLATLFVPAVVLLVPLYLTILNPPLIGTPLVNTFWAVWLPAGANAFNVLLVKRFFDSLSRDVFEAARMDGAGPFRLFWSVVLPMSKPIIGVVSVFAIVNAYKDFLWPLLVLPKPDLQPLSVRLPAIAPYTQMDVLLAALAIATIIPVAIFLVFQRVFLRGGGMEGAVKG